MDKLFQFMVLPGLAFLLSGCASVISQDVQPLSLAVTCKGVNFPSRCTASNSKGSWRFNTPQTRWVARDSEPLTIVCDSPSVGKYGVVQHPGVNPASFGNILIGGLVGVAVDATNDVFWSYPERISFESRFCTARPD